MPRLSVVIPTRERSDTLVHTLRTLVAQDYQDCEILVSDNASEDATKSVVQSFADRRIRYINTGRRVSMSENWEFALRNLRGEFVTFLGDDDGFIPGSISRAMALLEESKMSALVWGGGSYFWPDHVDESLRNTILLRAAANQIHVVEGTRKLRQTIGFRSAFNYKMLPCPYTGIVRKALFDKLTLASTNGIFFNSISPDLFSGLALSIVAGTYLLSERPFGVSGASRHSIGTSYTRHSTTSPSSPAMKFLQEVSLKYDDRIKLAPSDAASVMGEYLMVQKYFPGVKFPEPNWHRYISVLIRSARSSPFGDEILGSAAHTARMLGIKLKMPEGLRSDRQWHPGTGIQGDTIAFKAPCGMVNNIYDACQLMAGMLPAPDARNGDGSASRFAKNVAHCLLSEAKILYRSL